MQLLWFITFLLLSTGGCQLLWHWQWGIWGNVCGSETVATETEVLLQCWAQRAACTGSVMMVVLKCGEEAEGLLTKLKTIPTTPKRGVKWILSSHKGHHTPTKQSVVYRLYESAVKLSFWWLLTAWMRLLTYYRLKVQVYFECLFCFSKTNTIMKMIMQRWLKNLLKKLKAIHKTVSVWPDEDQE